MIIHLFGGIKSLLARNNTYFGAMIAESFPLTSEAYRTELLQNIIPFWEEHSIDREAGGFFTCLDREGKVFDRDKFLWLQGRQIWTFATFYREIEAKPAWLKIAQHGAAFLEEYGRSPEGDWYFSLSREGRPLVAPYNIFSDCFATQAFGALYRATGEERYAEIALSTFHRILARRENPKGRWSKAVPGTRPLKNFALPMILCNLALEIEPLLDKDIIDRLTEECLHEVMNVFYHEESGLILENVTPDGSFSDSFEGRLLNPGHAIEAMWFVTDLAVKKGDRALVDRAKEITLRTLEYAWDETHGGIYYFMDLLGHPPQQLEWDQKLWWVHLETLIALAKSYRYTKDERCRSWLEKVHSYTWPRFADPKYGEWFGYLDRSGEVLLPLKGGKWKGCYHVPRALWQISEALS